MDKRKSPASKLARRASQQSASGDPTNFTSPRFAPRTLATHHTIDHCASFQNTRDWSLAFLIAPPIASSPRIHHGRTSSDSGTGRPGICGRYALDRNANTFFVACLTVATDEIGALVLDPGSHSTRAGFAGEDTPKSVVPTNYGQLPTGERLFGDNAIHLPKADLEIRNPYNSDGIVDDWETAAKLWEYTITSRLTGARQTPPSKNGLNDTKDENGDTNMDEGMEQVEEQEKPLQEFPLLMSEPAWNPAKERQKTIEIAMEEWGVPAFFLAKNGQLAA